MERPAQRSRGAAGSPDRVRRTCRLATTYRGPVPNPGLTCENRNFSVPVSSGRFPAFRGLSRPGRGLRSARGLRRPNPRPGVGSGPEPRIPPPPLSALSGSSCRHPSGLNLETSGSPRLRRRSLADLALDLFEIGEIGQRLRGVINSLAAPGMVRRSVVLKEAEWRARYDRGDTGDTPSEHPPLSRAD